MANDDATSRAARDRQTWRAAVEELTAQVEAWARGRNWAVRREAKQVHESRLGTYTLPALSILAPAGQLQFDPVARDIVRGEGRVDLLGWPSLTRMMLIRTSGQWVLKTDSGVEWPEGWSEATFARMAELLNAAA